jgi:PAS domain-containing protein
MSQADSTQILPTIAWHDPRIHLLDDTWLLSIFAILFAIALPWLVSGLTIDFLPVAAGLLALGAIHIGFAALTTRPTVSRPRRGRLLAALHALGVLIIAFIWQHAGGLQNPLFLAVFALPIIGAIFISRWQPYFMAVLAALAVGLVAMAEAPELRWYAPLLSETAHWLQSATGGGGSRGSLPFAGFYAPAEYFVVLLEVFVIMLFACAIAAEYLGTIFDRLHTQITAARLEAERGQLLWSALIERLPLPAFLVDADTSAIVGVSAQALARYGAGDEPLVGRNFFETLHFAYPEVVQEFVGGEGGAAELCTLRHGNKLLATQVRVQHVAQKGRRFALVAIDDVTEAFCVKAALDGAEHAALVIDAEGRVLAFNRPARALFSDTEAGVELARLLPPPEPRWWDPGLSGRRKMHLTIMHRVYQVTSSAVVLPGEEARLYVLAFLPAAQVAAADQTSTTLTSLGRRP